MSWNGLITYIYICDSCGIYSLSLNCGKMFVSMMIKYIE